MENRFRLGTAADRELLGEDKGMFDVLVRMLGTKGSEVLPADSLRSRRTHDLMKNIDRWVIGASMSFAATAKAHAFSYGYRRTRSWTRAS